MQTEKQETEAETKMAKCWAQRVTAWVVMAQATSLPLLLLPTASSKVEAFTAPGVAEIAAPGKSGDSALELEGVTIDGS